MGCVIFCLWKASELGLHCFLFPIPIGQKLRLIYYILCFIKGFKILNVKVVQTTLLNFAMKELTLIFIVCFLGPTTPSPPCMDKIKTCETYGKGVCTKPEYKTWVYENCRYYCRLCSRKSRHRRTPSLHLFLTILFSLLSI